MKRGLLLFAMLGYGCYSFCQTSDSLTRLRDHYLLVGRRETKIGTIMIGGGVVLILTSAYIAFRVLDDHAAASTSFSQHLGTIALFTGDISTLAGIPVCIIGETHRSKAKHLSLDIQKSAALMRPGGISPVFQPALTLTVNLSKRKRTD